MPTLGARSSVALLLLAVGCSGGAAATTDASAPRDASVVDAPDVLSSTDVAAAPDAPEAPDAPTKPEDAPEAPDVGEAPPDAVADVSDAAVTVSLAIPCADSAGDVYVTPAGLPTFSMEHRGDVVRCAAGLEPARAAYDTAAAWTAST